VIKHSHSLDGDHLCVDSVHPTVTRTCDDQTTTRTTRSPRFVMEEMLISRLVFKACIFLMACPTLDALTTVDL
jgi:hypothetical protein